jgi:hypothetical protein
VESGPLIFSGSADGVAAADRQGTESVAAAACRVLMFTAIYLILNPDKEVLS